MKYVLLALSLIILSFTCTVVELPALAQAEAQVQTQVQTQAQTEADDQIQETQRSFVLGADKHITRRDPTFEPMTLNANLRRPFLFFREQANQPWPVLRLFIFLMTAAALAKILTPHLVRESIEKIQQKVFNSIAFSLLYTTLISTTARFAFHTPGEALVPLGLFCIGLVQASYIIGAALGVNLFASILHDKLNLNVRGSLTGAKTCLLYGLCLLFTAFVLAMISTMPEVWRFPRIGNRMVILVAMIGLGGLIARLRAPHK